MIRQDLRLVNVVGVAPFRRAPWEEPSAGRIVVVRPRPTPGPGRVRRWVHYLLGASRLRLDDVGSAAWRLLDGRRTVAQVAATLRAEFGERVEPAEERLGRLVRVLRQEGLVGYDGIDGRPPGVEPPLNPGVHH